MVFDGEFRTLTSPQIVTRAGIGMDYLNHNSRAEISRPLGQRGDLWLCIEEAVSVGTSFTLQNARDS